MHGHVARTLAFAVGGCASLAGCADASPETFSLAFAAAVGDAPFACGATYDGVGTGETAERRQYQVTDVRFYVSNVALVAHDGTEVPLELDATEHQTEDVALLDFEDGCAGGTPETNTSVVGVAPSRHYVGVCFDLGVPAELNHLAVDSVDTPAPLTTSGMMWSWQAGRKFLRIDGKGNPSGVGSAAQPFVVHLGSTGCVSPDPASPPSTCAHPNVARVCLDGFDPRTDTIVADVAALLATSDVSQNRNGGPGCMSGTGDDECAAILPRLGLPFEYTGASVPAPSVPSASSSFFRVGAR